MASTSFLKWPGMELTTWTAGSGLEAVFHEAHIVPSNILEKLGKPCTHSCWVGWCYILHDCYPSQTLWATHNFRWAVSFYGVMQVIWAMTLVAFLHSTPQSLSAELASSQPPYLDHHTTPSNDDETNMQYSLVTLDDVSKQFRPILMPTHYSPVCSAIRF